MSMMQLRFKQEKDGRIKTKWLPIYQAVQQTWINYARNSSRQSKNLCRFFYLSVGSLGAYRYTCVMVFCKDKVRLKSSTFLFTAHVLSWEGMIRYLQKNGMVKSTREIIDFIELFFRKARKLIFVLDPWLTTFCNFLLRIYGYLLIFVWFNYAPLFRETCIDRPSPRQL